jgi:hypothetical protein
VSLVSILQWNVGNFDVRLHPTGGGPRGMFYSYASASREEDLRGIARVILDQKPDVVALQELVVGADHHGRLEKLTGYQTAAAGDPAQRHTQALLIRPGLTATPGPAPEKFRGVCALIRDESGARYLAASTHSTAGRFTEERAAEHDALAAWAAKVREPLVVAGDFNFDEDPASFHGALERWSWLLPPLASSDWKRDCAALAALRAALQDAGAGAGPTAGMPRHWKKIALPWGAPLIPLAGLLGIGRLRSRLDYVWASSAFKPVEARVLPLTGPRSSGEDFPWMDHDPVAVRVALA